MQTAKQPVKLFIDHASQPSRAIVVFCRVANIPHEIVDTRISKMDHLKPEFAKINPNKKVPAIVHDGLNLAESHAIMRYLARTFNVAEQWYPRQDLKRTAKIDEYLDYHHTGTRRFSNLLFWSALGPAMGLQPPKTFDKEEATKEVERALKFLNNNYLGSTPYIAGDKPSIADLSAYEELIQLKFIDYPYNKYENVQKWVQRMEAIPEIQEENKLFDKFVAAFKAKMPKSKL